MFSTWFWKLSHHHDVTFRPQNIVLHQNWSETNIRMQQGCTGSDVQIVVTTFWFKIMFQYGGFVQTRYWQSKMMLLFFLKIDRKWILRFFFFFFFFLKYINAYVKFGQNHRFVLTSTLSKTKFRHQLCCKFSNIDVKLSNPRSCQYECIYQIWPHSINTEGKRTFWYEYFRYD